jgi:putative peptidoglycan lipid II flippase
LVITQVNLLIVTIFASTLASGSLAVFNLANNLQSFPVGIFGISFAIAAFPAISAKAFDKLVLVKYFSKTLRQIMFFIIPSTIILLFLRAQVIRLILGSGKFNWDDTVLTMNVLTLFALSLFAQASIPLIVRFFYARHDSKTPLVLGLISSAVEIVLAWYFIKEYQVAGLALAFSIACILQFSLLVYYLRVEIGYLDGRKILKSVFKMILSAGVAIVIIQQTKTILGHWLGLDYAWEVLLQTMIPASLGLASYLITAYYLKSPELSDLLNSVKRHIPWRQVPANDHTEARGI